MPALAAMLGIGVSIGDAVFGYQADTENPGISNQESPDQYVTTDNSTDTSETYYEIDSDDDNYDNDDYEEYYD